MDCPGCESGPANREKRYQETKNEAKRYAKEHNTEVYIVEDPVEGFVFRCPDALCGLRPLERIPVH